MLQPTRMLFQLFTESCPSTNCQKILERAPLFDKEAACLPDGISSNCAVSSLQQKQIVLSDAKSHHEMTRRRLPQPWTTKHDIFILLMAFFDSSNLIALFLHLRDAIAGEGRKKEETVLVKTCVFLFLAPGSRLMESHKHFWSWLLGGN